MSNPPQNNPSAIDKTQNDPLSELSFLIGYWQAISKPGEPTGSFNFDYQLQSQIIVRTNYADYPATKDRQAFQHEDLMVIYRDESRILRADYFDSEGHVIRYIGETTGANRVDFTTELSSSGPRYRLSYRLDDSGEIYGSFEIAPPNQPDGFMPYLTWIAIKSPQI
jgi:hypothetical protein